MKLIIHRSEEEKLIRRCSKNDTRAQKQLYDRYASKMLGVCLRYVREYDQAEDVMISAFVKVFEKIDQFSGEGSFEGWVRRIVVNEALTYLRRNKNMHLEVDIAQAEWEIDYGTLSNYLEAEDLLRLVQELPIGYRTIFNLYAIEGYAHKEIAEKLNISENNSRSQLSRARALLQKKLAETERTLKENIK